MKFFILKMVRWEVLALFMKAMKYIGGGKHISDVEFYDTDGTLCVATMFAYDNNFVDSVDIWKVDFSPLIKIPTNKNEFFTKYKLGTII